MDEQACQDAEHFLMGDYIPGNLADSSAVSIAYPLGSIAFTPRQSTAAGATPPTGSRPEAIRPPEEA